MSPQNVAHLAVLEIVNVQQANRFRSRMESSNNLQGPGEKRKPKQSSLHFFLDNPAHLEWLSQKADVCTLIIPEQDM